MNIYKKNNYSYLNEKGLELPKNGDSAFQIARSIFNSDVWLGDPHLMKLWIYLLGKAEFKKNSERRGKLVTSLRRIQQENSFLEPGGIIKKFWSRHKIVNMLADLKQKGRIIYKGTEKGTLINIIKYNEYQNLSHYKGTGKGNQKGHWGDTEGTLASEDSNVNDSSRAPKNAKNAKNAKEYIYSVFNFWNSLKIITHKNLEMKIGKMTFETCIKKALENNPTEKIKEAMQNYKIILEGGEYYWTYRWTLGEFLQRGLDKFLTENKPFENFVKEKKGGKDGRKYKGADKANSGKSKEYEGVYEV